MILYLLKLQNHSILDQLRLEEALLRADSRSFCILNVGSKPTCVLGISSKLEEMLKVDEARACDIAIVRRFSGGGTVLVDENTCFSTFIINTSEFQVHHNPDGLHQFANKIFVPFFAPLPFSFKENDYRMEEKKIGGNAQYFTKARAVHHTSFLYDWKRERMDLLKMPSKMPSYRNKRSHEEFLAPLKKYYPSKGEFLELLEKYIRSVYEVVDVSLEELNEVLDRPYRKSIQIL